MLVPSHHCFSQDSLLNIDNKVVTLKEVVVRSGMDVPGFIRRIQLDTSFYRAFKNLRESNYTALNDIRMLDKKSNVKGSLQSRTIQYFDSGCRRMETRDEKISGDIRNKKGGWNYYTAEMYAGLFFTNGEVCNENNTVSAAELSLRHKKGLEKHKEQLKMLFFNPGRKIPGIPFIGNKINIYEEPMASLYDFELDMESYRGQNCYVFSIRTRAGLSARQNGDIVINSVKTWFDQKDMKIVGRTYDLSYDAGVYDFDVQMQVEMDQLNGQVVPTLIRYTGSWKVALKKRETGIFTATLFGFH
ncbi:hypothetical protein ACFSQD_02635 [Flavihumibacter stibioxidans]|uniref:Uncharacterized protein n=1 Tax=Flavihumibacter stibioxidans TaxID=1834163 RepID=A0ABR7MBG2_9BACT|nr:hypothetical protein [Flavihumibacter stibioxidans]MBC6492380.1 hypothetical protein [Flavihumibacter stibioxidans]